MTQLEQALCDFTEAQARYCKAKRAYDKDLRMNRYGVDTYIKRRMNEAAKDMAAHFKEACALAAKGEGDEL